MRLTFHDPGHLALRRGIRAAVALPIGLALALYVMDDVKGVIFTLFGIVGLLINADFAGSTAQRLGSYLLTGAAGTVSLVIGWAISPSTITAVVVTVVVAFGLSFLNLLRGSVAVGTAAVQLIYIVAVSLQAEPGDLRSFLVGWWLAVLLSTITALVLLPHNRRSDVRAALADVFRATARGTETVWVKGEPPDPAAFAALSDAVQKLNQTYGGQPYRTFGLTRRDQSLTLLVAMANDLRTVLIDTLNPRGITLPTHTLPAVQRLAGTLVSSLDDLADAMGDPRHLPDVGALDEARVALVDSLSDWVVEQSAADVSSADISRAVAGNHALRILSLLVEQILQVARTANGGEQQEVTRGLPVPVLHTSTLMRSQFNLASPWLRNSLRSAVGLGLAVLVVQITGVEKGFWVLLGVVSILRFDAVGTRSFAWRAVAGTIAGVAIASVLLQLIGPHQWVLWVLLPIVTFLAAWMAVTVGFTAGQTAFSMLILIGLGIVSWPPQPNLAVVRVEDVALGAIVAVVVGVLMWPRGAVGHLRREIAQALRSSAQFIASALSVAAGEQSLDESGRARATAVADAERAAETYDVSLMQRGPSEDLRPWTHAVSSTYILISTGRVISTLSSANTAIAAEPSFVAALHQARAEALAHWNQVADDVLASPTPTRPVASGPVPAPEVSFGPVTTTDQARAVISTIWTIDWINHLDRLDPLPTA